MLEAFPSTSVVVSLFLSLEVLLLFIPLNFLFITLNTFSMFPLLLYIPFWNVFWLFLLYTSRRSWIWVVFSLLLLFLCLLHLLMCFVSCALSVNMYSGLYFSIPLIEAIANFVSCFGTFTACEYSIIFVSTSIAICDL